MDTIENYQQQIQLHKSNLDAYQMELDQIQIELSRLSDTTAALNQAAQAKRAELQGYGRGAASMILGSKFAASRRKEASYHRSVIAQQVADHKAKINSAKLELNERKRQLKELISEEKLAIRELETQLKQLQPKKATTSKSGSRGSASLAEQLSKLADLHQQGILTDEEFSAAKKRLLTQE